MNTIRFASKEEAVQIVSIWHHIFDDPLPYIESFIETFPVEECCIVAVEGESIAAMTFLLPASIVTNSGLRDAFYIYAMCTTEAFRGANIARQLLDYATEIGKQKEAFALFLIPASEELFGFYEKRGFEKIYQRPQFGTILPTRQGLEKLMFSHFESIMSIQQSAILSELSIIWPSRHIQFALRTKMQEGALIQLKKSNYIIASDENGAIIEQMPFDQLQCQNNYFGMIRFIEQYKFKGGCLPYFNWGLE